MAWSHLLMGIQQYSLECIHHSFSIQSSINRYMSIFPRHIFHISTCESLSFFLRQIFYSLEKQSLLISYWNPDWPHDLLCHSFPWVKKRGSKIWARGNKWAKVTRCEIFRPAERIEWGRLLCWDLVEEGLISRWKREKAKEHTVRGTLERIKKLLIKGVTWWYFNILILHKNGLRRGRKRRSF